MSDPTKAYTEEDMRLVREWMDSPCPHPQAESRSECAYCLLDFRAEARQERDVEWLTSLGVNLYEESADKPILAAATLAARQQEAVVAAVQKSQEERDRRPNRRKHILMLQKLATQSEREACERIVADETMRLCACGGSGPDEGCVVCDLYHRITDRLRERAK